VKIGEISRDLEKAQGFAKRDSDVVNTKTKQLAQAGISTSTAQR
jgi:hypothetical protein